VTVDNVAKENFFMLVRVRERDQSEHIKCCKLLTKEIGTQESYHKTNAESEKQNH
jgi:hypothetical protein